MVKYRCKKHGWPVNVLVNFHDDDEVTPLTAEFEVRK
jgi:hypothetical protein